MRIGFDIDGVVAEQHLIILRMIDMDSDLDRKDELFKYYYLHRRIEVNPIDFLAEEDELYLITGRSKKYWNITTEWKNRYFPKAKLVMLGQIEPEEDTEMEKWFVEQARMKAKALEKYDIDIYIEDTPEIVRELRKMNLKCLIIQYGGRIFDREIT